MPRITDDEFLSRIYNATLDDRVDWQPTANDNQFSASFAGKFTLLATQGFFHDGGTHSLVVQDATGESILRILSERDDRVAQIYELARRQALRIDEALNELLNEIDKSKA
jgi:hypothetical protein